MSASSMPPNDSICTADMEYETAPIPATIIRTPLSRAHRLGVLPSANRARDLGIGGGATARANRLGIGSSLGARAARFGLAPAVTPPEDDDAEKIA